MHRRCTSQIVGVAALVAVLGGLASGCSGHLSQGDDADGAPASSADDRTNFGEHIGPICAEKTLEVGLRKLDMLIALDTSASMLPAEVARRNLGDRGLCPNAGVRRDGPWPAGLSGPGHVQPIRL